MWVFSSTSLCSNASEWKRMQYYYCLYDHEHTAVCLDRWLAIFRPKTTGLRLPQNKFSCFFLRLFFPVFSMDLCQLCFSLVPTEFLRNSFCLLFVSRCTLIHFCLLHNRFFRIFKATPFRNYWTAFLKERTCEACCCCWKNTVYRNLIVSVFCWLKSTFRKTGKLFKFFFDLLNAEFLWIFERTSESVNKNKFIRPIRFCFYAFEHCVVLYEN